ncbi:hypothetical protein [Hymenobacter cavernae]|nr:hypothetical protein [Hymenobacter cavernae]
MPCCCYLISAAPMYLREWRHEPSFNNSGAMKPVCGPRFLF